MSMNARLAHIIAVPKENVKTYQAAFPAPVWWGMRVADTVVKVRHMLGQLLVFWQQLVVLYCAGL